MTGPHRLCLLLFSSIIVISQGCEQIQKADIILLVDESVSIIHRDWLKQKNFLDILTAKFDVAPDKIRVGLIAFDHNVRDVFTFDTYKSKEEVQNAIKKLNQKKGFTSIWKGIGAAETMFKKARPDVQQILVVLTDGQSNGADGPGKTKVAAEQLRATGVKIVSIGVGLSKYSLELKSIASGPEFMITVEDMSSLMASGFLDGTLSSINCVAKAAPQLLAQSVCKKIGKADLVLVVDQSASLNASQFNNDMKPFLKGLVEELPIGKDLVRVAIYKFSDGVQKVMNLGEFNTAKEINEQIDAMKKTGKNTMTQKALNEVREEELPKHGRKGVKKLVLVVTDGNPSYQTITARAAKALRDTGATVLAVGVGKTNDRELKKLASSESLISHIEETEQLRSDVLKKEIVISLQCANQ